MALFSRKNLKSNKFDIRPSDITGDIANFPTAVVVRMLEEQEAQCNEPDVKVFQEKSTVDRNEDGFDWQRN